MADFSDEHKEEMKSNYFGLGIHKVLISDVNFDWLITTEGGKEFAEFTVVDPDNSEKEEKPRLWFSSDGAIKYSFNTIRSIFVHNATEENKDKMREEFNKLKNTDELSKFCMGLVGKECWLQISNSPDRTYESNGRVYKSRDKNIYGYEPAPKDDAPDTVTVEDEASDDSNIDLDTIPF